MLPKAQIHVWHWAFLFFVFVQFGNIFRTQFFKNMFLLKIDLNKALMFLEMIN